MMDGKNATHLHEQHFLDFSFGNNLYYAFAGGCFNCPFQTFLPCILFTKYIIPTNMKKKGPKKPSKPINLEP